MDNVLLLGLGLLGLGVLLMALEGFVPSGGVLGLAAFASAVAGIVFLFKYDIMWGAIGTLGTVVLGPVVFMSAIKVLPGTPLGRIMVGQSGEEIAQANAQTKRSQRADRDALKGKEGVAITDMRPSGMIEIDGVRHDAIAQGGIIDRGQAIRVTNVDGLTIEIRAL